jgi:predicted GTPase
MFSPKDEYDFSIHSGESAQIAKQKLLDYYNEIKDNPNRHSQKEIRDEMEKYVKIISRAISKAGRDYHKITRKNSDN